MAGRKKTAKEVLTEAALAFGLEETKATLWKRTDKAMADFLGVEASAFGDAKRRHVGSFPTKKAKGWNTLEVVEYYAAAGWLGGEDQEGEEGPVSFTEARARKTLAEAIKAELVVEQLRKELIPASDVEAAWSGQVSGLDSHVEKTLPIIAPKLSGKDAPAILEELRDWWRETRTAIAEGKT